MPKLTEQQKHFVVCALASDYTPSEVAALVKEEFGIEVVRQQIHEYNPERKHGKPVAKKWVKVFDKARKEYEKTAGKVAIAKKAFRLRELLDLYRRAKQRGNHNLARDLLEQAAKESGGAFTNQRQITGKDGAPIEYRDLSHMSDEDITRRLAELTGGAGDGS